MNWAEFLNSTKIEQTMQHSVKSKDTIHLLLAQHFLVHI